MTFWKQPYMRLSRTPYAFPLQVLGLPDDEYITFCGAYNVFRDTPHYKALN